MFESAVMCDGTRNEHVKVALRKGSSQHGKIFRASIGSHCEETISFFSPFTSVYSLR